MRQTIFIYPTGGRTPKSSNPYIQNLKDALSKYYNVLHPTYKWKFPPPRMLVFLMNSFKADIYVLNWIENSASDRGGFIGGVISLIGLWIIKLRKVKIVWIFHNIHPHGGENLWSRFFQHFLFKNSSIIVAHSQEAADYARSFALCPVSFKNHPIQKTNFDNWGGKIQNCDFFIWGDILPYKGIPEFVENPLWQHSKKKILIIGKSVNNEIRERIRRYTKENICYEDRFASYSEIAAQCKVAKYVLFPYIGESISSSGVLMDTLLMGGTPVGPNRGAFADLAAQGCCITYNNINEVINYPTDKQHNYKLDKKKVSLFIKENTWDAFGTWLHKTI